MNEKLDAFLAELSALTRKHGIAIDGCGCCGSPFVYVPEPSEIENFEYTTGDSGRTLAPEEIAHNLRRKDR